MSANPTWRSLRSIRGGYSGCAKTWSASTTQMTLSSLIRSRRLGSLKVTKIPAGSATPLASSRMYSTGLRACEQGDDRLDEIVANLAADAAVGQADHVIVHPDDEFGVDIDRAKVVDEDPHAQAVIPGQDAIQQRRLSRPEKAGQDRDRNGFAVVVYDFHCLRVPLKKDVRTNRIILRRGRGASRRDGRGGTPDSHAIS